MSFSSTSVASDLPSIGRVMYLGSTRTKNDKIVYFWGPVSINDFHVRRGCRIGGELR
jgi:hypothetical protein